MNVLLIANIDPRSRHKVIEIPLQDDKEVYLTHFDGKGSFFSFLIRLIKSAKRFKKFDYVFLFNDGLKNLLIIKTCQFLNVNTVLRLGGNPLKTRKQVLDKLFAKRLLLPFVKQYINYQITKSVIGNTKGFVFNSKYLENEILNIKHVNKKAFTAVIPQYIDIPERDSIEEVSETFSLLTISSLDYQSKFEGLCFLVKSIHGFSDELLKYHDKIEFNIVSPGLFHQDFIAYCKSFNFSSGFALNIFDYQRETQKFYKAADIFVYSSNLDSLPNVVVEAQKHEVCTIVNDFEPILEIVEHDTNGLVFKTDDGDSLHEALFTLIKNPEKTQKLADNALEKLVYKMSRDAVKAKIKNFLKKK